MDAPAPWERQPGESAKAYAAFCIYRDLSPLERSLREVTIRLYHKSPEKVRRPSKQVQRWSVKWRWAERVAAWDGEVDRRRREAKLREAQEAQERHARIARAMLAVVARRLQQIEPVELSGRDVARWVAVAAELERLALEQPTALVQHRVDPAEAWVQSILEVWRRRREQQEDAGDG